MEVFDSAVIMKSMNQYLSLRDIIALTCTCTRLYSNDWRNKMVHILYLHERVQKRWNIALVPQWIDPIEFMRNRTLLSMEIVPRPRDYYSCWITQCDTGGRNDSNLANRELFPRTTCVECAENSVYWKEHFMESPTDCYDKVISEYPLTPQCFDIEMHKAEVNIYQFPPERDDSYEDGDDEDDYDRPPGLYYDCRIVRSLIESKMKKRKL